MVAKPGSSCTSDQQTVYHDRPGPTGRTVGPNGYAYIYNPDYSVVYYARQTLPLQELAMNDCQQPEVVMYLTAEHVQQKCQRRRCWP